VNVENGDKTLPLFLYLKHSLDGNMITGNKILWNFAKFLCNEEGIPVKRYAPTTGPMSISQDIEDLINK
jgi:glutathione peroxidase-family protein